MEKQNPLHPQIIPLVPTVNSKSWGASAVTSLVSRLACQNSFMAVDPTKPYAELVIGTQQTGEPTRLALNKDTTLLDCIRSEVIEVDPSKVEYYSRLHEHGLPFVLKVLSVAAPQSIHAHPDAVVANRCHVADPDLYPDFVAKPLMAVALTRTDALFGFQEAAAIVGELARVPEFADAVGRPETDRFVHVVKSGSVSMAAIRELFSSLMTRTSDFVATTLNAATTRLRAMPQEHVTASDRLLLALHAMYPSDSMCFCTYFFNHVVLEPGQAVFIHPNEPHSFLSGNLIEITSCSDAVMRAGLTDKRKAVDIFLDMLSYDDSPVEVCSYASIAFLVFWWGWWCLVFASVRGHAILTTLLPHCKRRCLQNCPLNSGIRRGAHQLVWDSVYSASG